MKKCIVAAISVLCICAGIAYAADDSAKTPPKSDKDLGTKTVVTVTDTAKAAVDGTTNIVKTSATDTVEAPKTAIEAVKYTANTALNRTDAVMKTITGEEDIK